MTRIFFLDVDGTMIGQRAMALPLNRAARGLLHDEPPPVFDAEAVSALNRILERSGAKVVVASTWAALGRERIEELLSENGVAATFHEDWRTRPLPYSSRWLEICLWLDVHPEIREWAAIDDDPSIARMRQGVHITDPHGLSLADVERVVALLGEGSEAVSPRGTPRTAAEYDARCRAVGERFRWAGFQVFGCPAGWLDLLEAGLAEAERRVHREDLHRLKLRRLAVWRGALRLDVTDAGAAAMLWRVERRSAQVCSGCGDAGVSRTDREDWPTLCDSCAALEDEELAGRLHPRSTADVDLGS